VSDNEHFLSRWSRRKQEAKQPPLEEQRPAADAAVVEAQNTEEVEQVVAQQPAEKFDVESLPPVDIIEATTDIRAFLTKGVPADLTKAALRRAWSSDPAIRDFVGLSENAWDFNAPESIPGFGGAMPADEVRRVLAQMMASEPEAESAEAPEAVAGEAIPTAETETEPAQTSGNTSQAEKHALVNSEEALDPTVAAADARQDTTIKNKNEDVAVQNQNNSGDMPTSSVKSEPDA
jgi:hypothetical protein